MTSRIGIWAVRARARDTGVLLAQRLGGTLSSPQEPAGTQKDQFRALFPQYSHWVLIMTTGIAVRYLDGAVTDKHHDPAVVVLDEGCRYAVSLLGGHEAGANALAYSVANVVGAIPVVTTATEALKPLVMGIGCRKGVSVEQIESAARHALGRRPLEDLREIATIDRKANEPALLRFCELHRIPLRILSTEQIAARAWVTQPSTWVQEQIGVDGVCEPCALICSPRGTLLVPKTSVQGVAVAVVEDRYGVAS